MAQHLFGDFDHQAVVGAFRPECRVISDSHPWLESFADRITTDGLA